MGQPKTPKRNLSHGARQPQAPLPTSPGPQRWPLVNWTCMRRCPGKQQEKPWSKCGPCRCSLPHDSQRQPRGLFRFPRMSLCQGKERTLPVGLWHAHVLTAKPRLMGKAPKAALLFSSCLDSTHHLRLIKSHDFSFSWGASAAILKVTRSLK